MKKIDKRQYNSREKAKKDEEKVIEEFTKTLIDVIEKEVAKHGKAELLRKIRASKKEDKSMPA